MAAKKDDTTYEDLRADMKAGRLGGAYVFHGEEAYLRERTLEEIQRILIAPGTEPFNLRTLEDGATGEEIVQAVDSVPMLGRHTLVIVRDLDLYKLDEATQEKITALLGDFPEFCVLIFVYDAIPYKTDARRKIHTVLNKNVKVINFSYNKSSKLVPWVRRHFRDGKKDISSSDAEYLIFRVGSSMSVLLGEIEKLIAYSRSGIVTRADIDAVIVPSLEAESFDLARNLCEGKYAQTFELLDKLFSLREEPGMILGALGWQLRRFYLASAAVQAGGGVKEMRSRCAGMSEYSARMFMKTASHLSPAWCRSALKLCAAADYDLKNSSGDERGVLETLFIRLAGEKKHADDQAGHSC